LDHLVLDADKVAIQISALEDLAEVRRQFEKEVRRLEPRMRALRARVFDARLEIVYAVVDDSLARHLLGDSIDVFVRRADAERSSRKSARTIRSSRSPTDSRFSACLLLMTPASYL
jgi:hypothetical protein